MHPSIIFRNPPWPSVCHATPAASLLLETGQSDWLLKSVWWGEGCAYHISKCLSEGVVLSCSRRPVVRRRGSRGEEHWPVSLPVASCKTPPQALGGGVEGHKGQDGLRSVVMKQCLGYWRYSYGTCYTMCTGSTFLTSYVCLLSRNLPKYISVAATESVQMSVKTLTCHACHIMS